MDRAAAAAASSSSERPASSVMSRRLSSGSPRAGASRSPAMASAVRRTRSAEARSATGGSSTSVSAVPGAGVDAENRACASSSRDGRAESSSKGQGSSVTVRESARNSVSWSAVLETVRPSTRTVRGEARRSDCHDATMPRPAAAWRSRPAIANSRSDRAESTTSGAASSTAISSRPRVRRDGRPRRGGRAGMVGLRLYPVACSGARGRARLPA